MSSEFSLTFLAAVSTGVISRAFNSAKIFFTDSGVEPFPTTSFSMSPNVSVPFSSYVFSSV